MIRLPTGVCACAVLALLWMPVGSPAQELEPGAYWPLPVGLNIVTVVNSLQLGRRRLRTVGADRRGQRHDQQHRLLVHPRVQPGGAIGERRRRVAGGCRPYRGPVPGRTRGGRSVRAGRSSAAPRHEPLRGAGDDAAGVRAYRQRTIVGVSLTVAPPPGQYDSAKLINIGTHRWSFKPEIGLSRAFGQWVVEGMAGVWLFTDNDDFLGGRTREQDPLPGSRPI